MTTTEPIEVTLAVTGVLERLGVEYLVGGSLATSLHGIPRATLDVDIVADLRMTHLEPFVTALREAFFVDADMVRDAIRRRATFSTSRPCSKSTYSWPALPIPMRSPCWRRPRPSGRRGTRYAGSGRSRMQAKAAPASPCVSARPPAQRRRWRPTRQPRGSRRNQSPPKSCPLMNRLWIAL
jgi:hypothetical protein